MMATFMGSTLGNDPDVIYQRHVYVEHEGWVFAETMKAIKELHDGGYLILGSLVNKHVQKVAYIHDSLLEYESWVITVYFKVVGSRS